MWNKTNGMNFKITKSTTTWKQQQKRTTFLPCAQFRALIPMDGSESITLPRGGGGVGDHPRSPSPYFGLKVIGDNLESRDFGEFFVQFFGTFWEFSAFISF